MLLRRIFFFISFSISVTWTALYPLDVCSVNNIVNGCSVPQAVPVPYQNEFLPACNRHDICYECGSLYGIPRYICDMKFFDDMESLCLTKGKSGFREDICRMGAHVYYRTVEMFGGSRWKTKYNAYCKQSWVPQCLPPVIVSPK